jgi:hypothetical protein
VSVLLVVIAAVIVAYWVGWYTDRKLLASETTAAYYQFENAFPLADGWLTVCLLAAAVALRRRSATALLWLLMGAGAGGYLFCMDVLYDLEHGIWSKGAGGAVELVINVATLAVTVGLTRWTWRRRVDLIRPDHVRTKTAAETVTSG